MREKYDDLSPPICQAFQMTTPVKPGGQNNSPSPSWPTYITAAGDIYDLSHLNEYQTVFTNKGGTKFNVTVKFAHHCFTRDQEPTDRPDMIYPNCPKGDERAFDFDRYSLSKNLVQYISGFMTGNCLDTGNGKFFVIRIVNYMGKDRDYEIYFRVYRSNNPRGLVLDIRSAYLRDPDRLGSRTHKGKIHFGAILNNVQVGKQPRPALLNKTKI